MGSWLPLSPCFYKMTYDYFYSPSQSQTFRLYNICKLFRTLKGNKEKYQKVLPFKEAIEKADRDGKLIAYISKMIFVPNKNINDKSNTGSQLLTGKSLAAKLDTSISNGNFFAFTRIFSGKIRVGDTVYLITNVLDKEDNEEKIKTIEFKVSKLFIWMGYHLDQVEQVGAGCICGIPDLGEYNVKFATVADSPDCPPLNKIKFENNLIKVAIKTKNLADMGKLNEGLRILKKIDPAIDTFYDEKGDIILETNGEVHLSRCLKDLQDEFAKVELEVSDPIVTFKETITANKFRSQTNKKKEELKKIRAQNKQAFQEDNKKEIREKDEVGDEQDKKDDKEDEELQEKQVDASKDGLSSQARPTGDEIAEKSIDQGSKEGAPSSQKKPESMTDDKSEPKQATPKKQKITEGLSSKKAAGKEFDEDKTEKSKASKDTKSKTGQTKDKDGGKDDQDNKPKKKKEETKAEKNHRGPKMEEAPEEKDAGNKDKLYRWNTESSAFFDTTSEEEPIDPSKAMEEWLNDDDRGTDKKDEGDIRYIYRESNFVYQKKRVEEVKVNRKGVNMKFGAQGFLGLQRKKNHCEVLTQNKKFKVAVRAVALDQKAAEYLNTHKNKVRKLFGNGPNMKRSADCVKFLKSFLKILEEVKTDPAFIKMIMRNLISFGPHKFGPNLLLCNFAEAPETLTAPLLSDLEEYKDVFIRTKRLESYIKDRPDYEQYYSGISYEELLKSIQVGFDLALEKGPLCSEEMYGCVFIVEDFINCDEENIQQQQLRNKLKHKEEKEKKQRPQEGEQTVKDDTNPNQRLEDKEGHPQVTIDTTSLPEPDTERPSHLEPGQSNMLEQLKHEGISCSRSKNSRSVTDEQLAADPYGPMSTQLVSAVKKGCTDSFLGAGPRLVHGLLLCTVFVDQETLSAVLDSLYMRRAEVFEQEFEHLTNMFIVKAHLPIQESFGFFETIMKLTSGKVSPQLEFAGWQVIDMDPFYQPITNDVRSIDIGKGRTR
jgi:translation elongation factor EF-G